MEDAAWVGGEEIDETAAAEADREAEADAGGFSAASEPKESRWVSSEEEDGSSDVPHAPLLTVTAA